MAKSNDPRVRQSDLALFYQRIQPYLNGATHTGFTPVGTIISLMGKSAPNNYLKCDGTVYNITDYPELATYFEEQFESSNFFGGDGETTFAVPNLQGEFLRGTGANPYAAQFNGDGGAVGTHQHSTLFNNVYGNSNNKAAAFVGHPDGGNNMATTRMDTRVLGSEFAGGKRVTISGGTVANLATDVSGRFTAVPTNTAVLFCIACKNIYIDARYDYSLNEKVVGTWIDGSTLYQKTYHATTPSTANTNTNVIDISDINLGILISLEGALIYASAMFPANSFDSDTGNAFTVWARLPDNTTNKNQIAMRVGTNRLSMGCYVTIRYTKSVN